MASNNFQSVPAKFPNLWLPSLYNWQIYHCSSPDVSKVGWRKWSAELPDWYAYRGTSMHPDWHNRRVNTIRRVHYKNTTWHHEKPSKPTSRSHDTFQPYENDVMKNRTHPPMAENRDMKGQFSYVRHFPRDVPTPKWGLFSPPHYQAPARFNHYPPTK